MDTGDPGESASRGQSLDVGVAKLFRTGRTMGSVFSGVNQGIPAEFH